jgi:hypothetical protein
VYVCISLHLKLPKDGDLSPKHVAGYKLAYHFWFCYVDMLVSVSECSQAQWTQLSQIDRLKLLDKFSAFGTGVFKTCDSVKDLCRYRL